MKRFESVFYLIVCAGLVLRYAGGDSDDRRPIPDFEPSPSQLEEALPGDVVVEIEARAQDGTGTAFSVGEGRWLTAKHVIHQCKRVFLDYPGARPIKVQRFFESRRHDMALLETGSFSRAPFGYSDRLPARGATGYLLGYPQGNPGDIAAQMLGSKRMRSVGVYTMREKVFAWVERQRAPNFSGSAAGISGGPVFNDAGEIAGTVVAGAPRRGRLYTTHPNTLTETEFANPSDGLGEPVKARLSGQSFGDIGRSLRRTGRIARVICLA